MTPKLLAGLAVGLLSMSSHAAIVVTIKQVGADVVVMGGGTATAPGLVLIQKYSDLEGFLNPLSGGFAMGRPYELAGIHRACGLA